MVNFPSLSYSVIIQRFRQYSLIQQSAIAAFFMLLIYIPIPIFC